MSPDDVTRSLAADPRFPGVLKLAEATANAGTPSASSAVITSAQREALIKEAVQRGQTPEMAELLMRRRERRIDLQRRGHSDETVEATLASEFSQLFVAGGEAQESGKGKSKGKGKGKGKAKGN